MVNKFIPTNVEECPLPIQDLQPFRRTVIHHHFGRTVSSKIVNWTAPGRAQERITPAWRGETRLFLEETTRSDFKQLEETITGDDRDLREMEPPIDPYTTRHGLTEDTTDFWENKVGYGSDTTSYHDIHHLTRQAT